MNKIGGVCSLDGCDQVFYAKSLCRKHYDQERNAIRKFAVSEQSRKYYEENKQRILDDKKEYRANNPEVARRGRRARRARQRNSNSVPYTEHEVIETYGSNCYICYEQIDLNAPRRTGIAGWEVGLHVDHVIPICAGGTDSIENVRPAHGLCNLRKARK